MKTDQWGTVYNCSENFKELAQKLKGGNHYIFAWTDRLGTQYDIYLATKPEHLGGILQGGIKQGDLFVGIMRVGIFGFNIDRISKHPSYIAEKLKISSPCSTTNRLAILINGIIRELCID